MTCSPFPMAPSKDTAFTFPNREDLSDALQNGLVLPNGALMSDGTVLYIYEAGATDIADMPNVKPFGRVICPDHYATNLAATNDMSAAIISADTFALANGRDLVGIGEYGVQNRVQINNPTARLKLKVLPGFSVNEGGGYEQNYVVRSGIGVTSDDFVNLDVEIDGDDQDGIIVGGWDPSKPWEGGVTTVDIPSLGEQNQIAVTETNTGPSRNAAYKLIPTAVSGGHHVGTDVAVTSGQVYGIGCYVKAGEYPGVQLFFESTGFGSGKDVVFDAQNNAWSNVGAGVGYYSVDLGKGWYWIGAWATATTTANARLLVRVVDGSLSSNFAGDDTSGVIISDYTEGLFEGPFPARWLDSDQTDFPATSLVNGQRARIWSVGSTDFTAIGSRENSAGVVFTATGPGTGTGEVTTIAENAVQDTDYFGVVWPTNVNGEEFAVHDALRAIVNNPDPYTFAGNWKIQDRIAGVLVQGVATPHSRFTVSVSNFDTALAVRGNSERIKTDVSAAFCSTALWEDYDDAGAGTPDNNTHTVRTSSVSQIYANNNKPLSEIYFNCQSTLSRCFDLPYILDQGGRTRGMFGNVRTPASYASFRGNGIDSSWKFNLNLENPGNARSHIVDKQPLVVVDSAEYLSGRLVMDQPIDGAWMKESGSCDLSLMVMDAEGGKAAILGDSATDSAFQGNLTIITGGVDELVESMKSTACVKVVGPARKVTHRAGTRAYYNLPSTIISSDVEIVNGSGDPIFDFSGAINESDFTSYSYGVLGMRGYLSDRYNERVFYDGTEWLREAGFKSGNFTPTLMVGGTPVTLSSASGRYIRTGDTVRCTGIVTVSNLGAATGAVDIGFEDTPYTSRNDLPSGGGQIVQGTNMSITAGQNVVIQVLDNVTSARLLQWDSTGGTSNLTHNELTNTTSLRFEFAFEI